MGWDLDTTIAKLHRFWWWCVDYAENGDLRKHSNERVGRAVGLTNGESTRFVEAMVSSGWIDTEPYRRVHDWWDYIGLFLQRRYGNKNSEKWKAVHRLYNGSTNVVQQLAQPTVPTLPTVPTNLKGEQVDEVVVHWNSKSALPRIVVMSDTRKEKLRVRLKSPFFVENWRAAIDKLVTSPFCTGSNDRGWKADIDWFIKDDTVTARILEGKYHNQGKPQKSFVDRMLEKEAIYENDGYKK
jgi:hypothetical protein